MSSVIITKGDLVSIHASVKDATHGIWLSTSLVRFNPRICKRCDGRAKTKEESPEVSIHASVKDATHADDVPDPN